MKTETPCCICDSVLLFAGKVLNKLNSVFLQFRWQFSSGKFGAYSNRAKLLGVYVLMQVRIYARIIINNFHLHKCLTSQTEVRDIRKLMEGRTVFPCTRLFAHCRIYGISDPTSQMLHYHRHQDHCDETKPLQLLTTNFVQ